MAPTRYTRSDVTTALTAFLTATDELTDKAWCSRITDLHLMSPGTVASILQMPSFTVGVCDWASEHADPGHVYRWGMCPRRQRHRRDLFCGTRRAWRRGWCPSCAHADAIHAALTATAAPLADTHPHLVTHLVDPHEAYAPADTVTGFRCAGCRTPITWHPQHGTDPLCPWCATGRQYRPGALVPVTREHESSTDIRLSVALVALGVRTSTRHAIAARRGTWPEPLITAGITVPDRRVTIDTALPDTALPDTARRDDALRAVGWTALHVTRPHATHGLEHGSGRGHGRLTVSTEVTDPGTLARLLAAHPALQP